MDTHTVGRLPCIIYGLFALVLPLSLEVATGLMWLILVLALFTACRLPSTIQRPSLVVLLPAIFFLLHALALTYTKDIHVGLSELLLKSPLLIFPLAVWLLPPRREDLRRILGCFVLGCLLTGLVCFVRSLINYHEMGRMSWLSYTWLSSQVRFLPSYLSMYMGFTFFIVSNDWTKEWNKEQIWQKAVGFFALLFTGYMIVMLGARLVGVTFFVLLVGGFLTWMYRCNMLLKGIFAVFLFAVALWKLMSIFFVTRIRMNKIVGKQLVDYDHNFFININDPRGQIWESCLAIIEHMPVYGYGIDDELETILLQMYDLKNYHHLLPVDTDAHNQYVQTLLLLGYPGLVCLVLMLALPLYLSWKTKKYLYVLFLLFISVPMLTECMLETAHGLMYFSFFSSLLSWLLFRYSLIRSSQCSKDSPVGRVV